MTVVSFTSLFFNVVAGPTRRTATRTIRDNLREARVRMTSDGSYDAQIGNGRIVSWGVELRDAGDAVRKTITVNDIPFGTHEKGGGLPSFEVPTEDIGHLIGARGNLFVQTEGVTIRLGYTIDASDTVGEIIT